VVASGDGKNTESNPSPEVESTSCGSCGGPFELSATGDGLKDSGMEDDRACREGAGASEGIVGMTETGREPLACVMTFGRGRGPFSACLGGDTEVEPKPSKGNGEAGECGVSGSFDTPALEADEEDE